MLSEASNVLEEFLEIIQAQEIRADGILDILEGLVLGLTLRDTPFQRRAVNYIASNLFILFQNHRVFHCQPSFQFVARQEVDRGTWYL